MTMLEMGLKRTAWRSLTKRVESARVTPIVSGHIFEKNLPGHPDLLREWAEEIEYPESAQLSITDLVRFCSLEVGGSMAAIEMFADFCRDYLAEIMGSSANKQAVVEENQTAEDSVKLLAQMNVPVYITTSHNQLLEKALIKEGKTPESEACFWRETAYNDDYANGEGRHLSLSDTMPDRRKMLDIIEPALSLADMNALCFALNWDDENIGGDIKQEKFIEIIKKVENFGLWQSFWENLRNINPHIEWEQLGFYADDQPLFVFDRDPAYDPTPDRPLVYHIFGLDKHPETLVLTEDDYLDFLTRISWQNKQVILPRVREALADTALVMLGFNMHDWEFKILFRGLIATDTRKRGERVGNSVSVQLQRRDGGEISELTAYHAYMRKYFSNSAKFNIYWGKPEQFMQELWSHLKSD